MDLMALVRSIEELLYEILSWFIFLPLTLWYCIRFPLRMMRYGASEIADESEHRFAEALSPPILMFLTIGILHLFDSGISAPQNALVSWITEDDRNLLVFRAVVFSLLPLLLASVDLRLRRSALTRETLRPAFYSHSYVAAPFILALCIAMIIAQQDFAGNLTLAFLIVLAGTIWYVAAVVNWLRHDMQLSLVKSIAVTVGTLVGFVALVLSFFVAIAVWPTA
jgi:hypothetical protein